MGGGGGGETDQACVGSGGPIISTRHGYGGAKWVRWGEAVHWSFLFIYFIHLIIFTQGSFSRKAWSSKALRKRIFTFIFLFFLFFLTIIFTFPLEQGKENDAPFISSLAFIPVNQRQKMSSDSLFTTCSNSPHACLWPGCSTS